jgi:glyoxylase-like metal-dependent hydrolase (beta-lactamase superfamily II)
MSNSIDMKEVAENIYLIDNQLYSMPKWGAVYLIKEEITALVDPGPTTSVKAVLDGIEKIGVRVEDIDYIVVTHIHLDHSGGVGVLIRNMPKAQVLVHQRGSRHLADPAKLVASVIEAQGEKAKAVYGDVAPVEAQRIKQVYDGDAISLGAKQVLKFIDAPGHAPHELCVFESRNNGLFCGDAVGVYIADADLLFPATQPPNFDRELWLNTIDKLMSLEAARIYFPHFGVSEKVQEILKTAIGNLHAWDNIVNEALKENRFSDAAAELAAHAYNKLEPVKEMKRLYEYLVSFSMPTSIQGFMKYYQDKYRLN